MAIVQATNQAETQAENATNVVNTKTMSQNEVQNAAQQATQSSTTSSSIVVNQSSNVDSNQVSDNEPNKVSSDTTQVTKQATTDSQVVANNQNQVANQITSQVVIKDAVSQVNRQNTTDVKPVINYDQTVNNNVNNSYVAVSDKVSDNNVSTNVVTNDNNQVKPVVQNRQVRDTSTTPVNAPITDKTPAAVDNDHTPDYHLSTNQGWSNDVQSIVKNSATGQYDIYFLHSVDGAANPFGTSGQNWEHVTTSDFKHFNNEGIAINSHGTDNVNSWKSAWTGSVVQNKGNIVGVPNGAEVAYFSGLSKADGSQNIWAAWSDDNGKTFTHALNDGAPVLAWNQDGASGQKDQERDADVIYWNNEMLMYCAEGDKLGVYKSTDGVHWTKADSNGASKVMSYTFYHGGNWSDADIPVECPQIREMNVYDAHQNVVGHKTVLFFGGKDVNGKPAQTTGTYYIVGHLDQNGLFAADGDVQRLDLGSDYYGSNVDGNTTLDTPVDSLIGLGWIGNWNYTSGGVYNNQNDHSYPADKSQLENHLGSYSLPHYMQLYNENGKYELQSVIGNQALNVNSMSSKLVSGGTDIGKQDDAYGEVYKVFDENNDPASSIYDLSLTTKDGKPYTGRVYIKLSQGKDDLVFNYDPDNGKMMVNGVAQELDNDISGMNASNAYKNGALGNGQGYLVDTQDNYRQVKNNIEIYCDKNCVEVAFPSGQIYTVARYATDNNQHLEVWGQDPNKDDYLTLYKQSLSSSNISNMPGNETGNMPGSTDQPYIYKVNYVDDNGKSLGTATFASANELASDSLNQKVSDEKPSAVLSISNVKIDNVNKDDVGDGLVYTTLTAVAKTYRTGTVTTVPTITGIYKYTVHYFDNDTGVDAGSATFTSSSPLSDSDLANKVQGGTKEKVDSYNVDNTSDDGKTIDIIANVSSSNSTPQATTYKYTVTYIDNNSGSQVGTTSFTSSSQLSNSDLGNKVQAGTQEHVTGYKADSTSTNGNEVDINIIANVENQSNQPKSYSYSVAYFDLNTGEQVGTASFTSSTALSDSDVAKDVQNGTKDKVLNYKVDETKPSADGSSEAITIIAYVDTGSTSSQPVTGNNNSGSTSNNKPASGTTSGSQSQPASGTTSSTPSSTTKPSTSGSTSQPSNGSNSSTPSTSMGSGATDSNKPASGSTTSQPSIGSTTETKPSTSTGISSTDSNKPVSGSVTTGTNTGSQSQPSSGTTSTPSLNNGSSSTTKPSSGSSIPSTGVSNNGGTTSQPSSGSESSSKPVTGSSNFVPTTDTNKSSTGVNHMPTMGSTSLQPSTGGLNIDNSQPVSGDNSSSDKIPVTSVGSSSVGGTESINNNNHTSDSSSLTYTDTTSDANVADSDKQVSNKYSAGPIYFGDNQFVTQHVGTTSVASATSSVERQSNATTMAQRKANALPIYSVKSLSNQSQTSQNMSVRQQDALNQMYDNDALVLPQTGEYSSNLTVTGLAVVFMAMTIIYKKKRD